MGYTSVKSIIFHFCEKKCKNGVQRLWFFAFFTCFTIKIVFWDSIYTKSKVATLGFFQKRPKIKFWALAAEPHFWTLFFTKVGNFRFYTSVSDFIKFPIKSILHYNTWFSWNFITKSKVATFRFFQKKTKNQQK